MAAADHDSGSVIQQDASDDRTLSATSDASHSLWRGLISLAILVAMVVGLLLDLIATTGVFALLMRRAPQPQRV